MYQYRHKFEAFMWHTATKHWRFIFFTLLYHSVILFDHTEWKAAKMQFEVHKTYNADGQLCSQESGGYDSSWTAPTHFAYWAYFYKAKATASSFCIYGREWWVHQHTSGITNTSVSVLSELCLCLWAFLLLWRTYHSTLIYTPGTYMSKMCSWQMRCRESCTILRRRRQDCHELKKENNISLNIPLSYLVHTRS